MEASAQLKQRESQIQANAVRDRLIDGYVTQLPATLAGIVVLLILNGWYYSDHIPASILSIWLATMLLGLTPYTAIVCLHRTDPRSCRNQKCVYWMTLSSLILGLGWSGIAIYAIEQLSTTHSYVAIILAAGVVGAATATNSALPITFKALTWAVLGPLTAVLLLNEHSGYQVVGGACLVYMVVMLNSVDQIHHALRQSITLTQANASLISRLEQQSTTDDLTGLKNRRALNQSCDTAWSQARAQAKPVGLLLCDVDFFKSYNDSLGHQAGDACLEQIAAALADSMRSTDDVVARYGGEEFAILMANSSPQILEQVGERIRKTVRDLRIEHPASSACRHVTISVGASQMVPSPYNNVSDLLSCADNALYGAKANGRNRVHLVIPDSASGSSRTDKEKADKERADKDTELSVLDLQGSTLQP